MKKRKGKEARCSGFIPVIPALRTLRQEDCFEFRVSLACIMRPYLKRKYTYTYNSVCLQHLKPSDGTYMGPQKHSSVPSVTKGMQD